MPRTPRKAAGGNFTSYTTTTTTKRSSSSSGSGAALNVTKFGQTTYTAIRRGNDSENGHFDSFKTTQENKKPEKEDKTIIKSENAPKAKVYKFFKSRSAPSDESSNGKTVSANNTPPKQINVNTQAQSKKRVLSPVEKKNTRIKENRESNVKTLDFSKASAIVLKNDQEDKKSTAKSTPHVIKNNARKSNVRCVSSPSPLFTSPAAGVRTSRRLKGVEPEHVKSDITNQDDQKNQLAAAIQNVFGLTEKTEQDSPPASCELHTLNGNYENQSCGQVLNEKEAKFESSEPQLIAQTNSENDFNFELDSEDVEKDVDLAQPIKSDNKQCKQIVKEESFIPPQPTDNVEDKVQPSDEARTKTIAGAEKPKKKIFFNRSRNKVEFNTKSFFASGSKDEFDIDSKEDQANVAPSNVAKKHELDDDSYLKLKRIRKAHQCHDSGETEQFDEDIKYYLSGIVSTNPVSMRCLSIIALSQHAMRPEFRMHLRAHDDMPQIMKALMDAPNDANLALCAACLMFVYNQDRMTMDIDPNALSLMLELLQTRSDECNQVQDKHRSNVVSLVEDMKNKGHAKYLKLSEITAGKLAMETLLGLTSKRAGDWFKMELRKMKGIDFIVNTVMRCTDSHLEDGQMVKIDRCMHVLENVSFENHENQVYITNYNDGQFISKCIQLLRMCKQEILNANESKIFLSAFFSVLRVLTNLTSESVEGCTVVGSFPGIIKLLLDSLFELPSVIIQDQRFDLMVIILCLCINLAEFCTEVRSLVIENDEHVVKLTGLLFKKIEEAAQVEQQTDHLLESHESVQMTEAMQDNLLMQMISKSGTHMEHSLISACVCLLFGCCVQENAEYRNRLESNLPDGSFHPLIEMLEKLRDFAHLADIMTQKGKDRVTKILKMFKSYKRQKEEPE